MTQSNFSNVDLSFLKRGTVISIRHALMFEPSTSVIQKVEGSNVFFRLPESFLKSNVLKGDQVVIQIFMEDHEYVLQGMISEMEIQYPRNVQVNVEKVIKYKNSRKCKRYIVNLQANIFVPGLDKNIYAVIKNVSQTGIGAVFKEHLNTEILVNVRVSVSISKNEFINFKAQVIRATPKTNFNEYGMEITEIDDINKDALDKLIYLLHENEKLFIAEYLK